MVRPTYVYTTGREGNPLDLPILPEEHAGLADYVICPSPLDEERPPPPEGDEDVFGRCSKCRRGIVYRKSAPDVPKICFVCFDQLRRGKWTE